MKTHRSTSGEYKFSQLSSDRLILYGIIRKVARIVLLAGTLYFIALISMAVFAREGWLLLAEWLLLAYASLAVLIAGYQSSVSFLTVASVVLLGVAMDTVVREKPFATLVLLLAATAEAVAILEFLYRVELRKLGGGYRLRTRPESHHQPAHIRSTSALRMLGFKLLALMLMLVVTALSVMLLTGQVPSDPTFYPAIFVMVFFIRNTLRRVRRAEVVMGHEATALDKRPSILILRSFRDDDIVIAGQSLVFRATSRRRPRASVFPRWMLPGRPPGTSEEHSLEEEIAAALSGRGPVIALGVPGEKVTPLGAARDYVSAKDWQAAIRQMMQDAQAIVVIAGSSPGLKWELDEIREHRFMEKTIVVVPPVKRAPKGTESGADAAERLNSTLRPLGVAANTSALNAKAARALLVRSGRVRVFLSRFRNSASVIETLRVAATYIPTPERREIARDQGRSRLAALLMGRRILLGLPAAVAVIACTPLLFLVGITSAGGAFDTGVLARLALGALFATNLALGCTFIFCWLVRVQSRYSSGREYMEDIIRAVGVSMLPLFIVLAAVTLVSFVVGADGFLFAKVGIREKLSTLTGWQLATGMVFYGCVPWALVRFMARLRLLWGGTWRAAALTVTLAAMVSIGLFFVGRTAVEDFTRPSPEEAAREMLQRAWGTDEERTASPPADLRLCRDFNIDQEADLVRWGTSLGQFEGVLEGLTDEEDTILGYRYCVEGPVPLLILLRAECEYRLGAVLKRI